MNIKELENLNLSNVKSVGNVYTVMGVEYYNVYMDSNNSILIMEHSFPREMFMKILESVKIEKNMDLLINSIKKIRDLSTVHLGLIKSSPEEIENVLDKIHELSKMTIRRTHKSRIHNRG